MKDNLIKNYNSKRKTLKIFDVSGKLVLTQKISGLRNSIDVVSLNEFYYNISISTSENTTNKELLIIRN